MLIKTLSNVVDFNFGVLGAVTFFLTETFAAFLLVSNYFIALHLSKDLCLDLYATVGEGQIAIGIGHNHIRELHFSAGVATDFGDVQSLVFFNLKLLTGYFYDCEHNGSKIRCAKVRERYEIEKGRRKKSQTGVNF